MSFPRITVFFIFGALLTSYIVPSKSQKCKKCQPRNFTENSQACTCPEKQFCDPSITKCTKCNECYKLYDNLTMIKRSEISNILMKFSKKYEIDLNELQRLVKILTDSVPKRENELIQLGAASDKVGKEIAETKKLFDELKKSLEKLLKLKPSSDIFKELNDIKNAMKIMLEQLKKLKYDFDWQLVDLKNISETINNLNRNLPTVEIYKDPLVFSLGLENDIELLESIISKFEKGLINGRDIPKNLWESTKWMEIDLLWLFNILNNYQNVTFDVNQMKNNASTLKIATDKILEKLDALLKKHENFEKLIKILENEHYKALMTKRFEKELKKFYEEQKTFEKKEKQMRRNKEKMDKLVDEGTELVKKFDAVGDVRPVDELLHEIDEITSEIEEIARNVSVKC